MKKLRIIYTGGTIGGKTNQDGIIDDDIKSKKFINSLSKKYPALKHDLDSIGVTLSSVTPIKEFSENICPSDWSAIARAVFNACADGVDAIVIAHGTDTMAYSSAALSFMLAGIKIPVILTGSNYPIEAPVTDAAQNMHDAIRVALDDRFRGVYLVFSGIENRPGNIHLGCRVRKIKFCGNCYKSINVETIGTFHKTWFSSFYSIKIINDKLLNQVAELHAERSFELRDNLVDKVLFLKVYPGFNPDLISLVIEKNEVKGLILELYSSGTGCVKGKYSLLKSIEHANSKNYGIPVFITSQHEGRVVMNTYISSKEILAVGAIPLKDMISEAAIPKLMWSLAQANSKNDVINLMSSNICGEIENETT